MEIPSVEGRPIIATEVMEWRGSSSRCTSIITDAQCATIANKLTLMRWPTDRITTGKPVTAATPANEYWDFDRATNAARALLGDVPAMLGHWEGLLWAPNTAGDYPAIEQLQKALLVAMPYIENPFGEYKKRTGHKDAKLWHSYATVIANFIAKMLVDSGEATPALTHNSVMVRIIYQAIRRMRIPGSDMMTRPAIGAYLGRRQELYGAGIGNKAGSES